MEEGKVAENSLTSAVAFVEGGIQEACDDACSICLEAFCDSDPSTVTSCKHEFHLQCILEWCQRSSQCPMCWQTISLKDPSSQELLDAVEHERNMRMNALRNTTVFHHPSLGDFELQHLPVSASESELEERIMQHLAAAAAMGRARHFARRDGQRNRSSTQGHPHFLVFSAHPNGPPPTSAPFIAVEDSSPQISSAQSDQIAASGSSSAAYQHEGSPPQTSPGSQDRAGPSDIQSFSETLKSRLSTLSMKYKESITKTTRGWRERLFARNNQTPDHPTAEVHRVSDQGTTTLSRMMDHLEIAVDGRTTTSTVGLTPDRTEGPSSNEGNTLAPRAATSASN